MIAATALFALAMSTMAVAPDQPAHHASGAASQARSFGQISTAAMKAWNEKRDKDAMALFRQGLKLHPDWNEGLWYLGAILYDHDQYSDARDQLRRYLSLNPKNGEGWALVGLSDYKLREFTHAAEDLNRAVQNGLGGHWDLTGPSYYFSALLLTRDGHFAESSQLLYVLKDGDDGRTRVDVPLEVPMGLNALGYAMLPEEVPADLVPLARQAGVATFARFEGRPGEAKNIFEQLLKQYPNEQGLHFQLGYLLLLEHSADGVGEMQKAIALAPYDFEPLLSLADYYNDTGKYDEALVDVDKALALDSTVVSAHVTRGRILNAKGDTAGAIAEFETARKAGTSDNRVLWELARAYRKAGRQEEAAQVMKELQQQNALPQTPKQ
jgi:tetratricopeptide (TPR) repeat protein